MASIELQGIAHSYSKAADGEWAIKPDLSHKWNDGGAHALLGPSGCGKTTLLSIISGLLTPSRGGVLFDGKDVVSLPPEKRNIAQVFQFPVVYDTMTARENIAFPLKNRGADERDINARVGEVAELLELGEVLDRRAGGLPPDAKQKIALGRGLARADIDAILFDEPLTVIDPHIRWRLRSNLKALRRKTNFTMVYVTHDQTEALTFAEQIVVMHEGRIVQSGSPADLFERPEHTFVGHFIGSPGMNVMHCELADGAPYFCGRKIESAFSCDAPPEGKTELGVRPEYVRFCADGIPAEVRRVRDLGRRRIIDLAVGGEEIKMSAQEHEEIPSQPKISFEPSRAFVYINGVIAGRQP